MSNPLNSVLAVVKAWQVEPDLLSYRGICGSVQEYVTGITGKYVAVELDHEMLQREYPEYSLDVMYPVPSPFDNLSPAECYKTHEMYIGEYGESRKRLVEVLRRAEISVEHVVGDEDEAYILITFK